MQEGYGDTDLTSRQGLVYMTWGEYIACQLPLVAELLMNKILRQTFFFSSDIVPPKVLVKDFMESLKKKSRKTSIEIHSSSSDSESE